MKREVVQQVYRVKRDGRRCAVPDLAPRNKKPVESTLAVKGKRVKRVTFKDPIVESGQAKPEVPKTKRNLPVLTPKQ